jgi:hypothetical protein
MKILLALAIVAIIYGFYSNYGVDKSVAKEEVNAEPAKPESTFLDTQIQAIEKAKKVESVLQESADRRRTEIDGQ